MNHFCCFIACLFPVLEHLALDRALYRVYIKLLSTISHSMHQRVTELEITTIVNGNGTYSPGSGSSQALHYMEWTFVSGSANGTHRRMRFLQASYPMNKNGILPKILDANQG